MRLSISLRWRRSRRALVSGPRLVVVVLVLVALGPVLGAQLVRFTHALLLAIPSIR